MKPENLNEESEGGLSIRVLLAVLEPVIDWYQSDEEDARPPLDILRDIVADLQTDRAEVLVLRAQRLVRMANVVRIVSEHPEYPEPCPMLHDIAAKAAAEMDKEWVMHMVRETCRQTKEAILADLQQSLPNAERRQPEGEKNL